jgi:hypothetical protein
MKLVAGAITATFILLRFTIQFGRTPQAPLDRTESLRVLLFVDCYFGLYVHNLLRALYLPLTGFLGPG